jgi:hypothetical protein
MNSFVDAARFRRNLTEHLVFSLPVLYLGIILAVSVHEIVGHGLAAHLLGGRFKGFGLAIDGMGWANVDILGLPASGKALVLWAGASATAVFSLVFFLLSMFFKARPYAQTAFLLLAVVCLMDGVPYFFWDAVLLGGIGDFSMIWMMYPDSTVRAAVILLFGLAMTAGIVYFNTRFFRISCRRLGEGKSLTLGGRAVLAFMILLLQAFGWFTFDWNQLVPGVGLLPGIVALALTLATLGFLIRPRMNTRIDSPGTTRVRGKAPLIAAWAISAGMALCIALWLQKGVTF